MTVVPGLISSAQPLSSGAWPIDERLPLDLLVILSSMSVAGLTLTRQIACLTVLRTPASYFRLGSTAETWLFRMIPRTPQSMLRCKVQRPVEQRCGQSGEVWMRRVPTSGQAHRGWKSLTV